jgi:hypothetical protein
MANSGRGWLATGRTSKPWISWTCATNHRVNSSFAPAIVANYRATGVISLQSDHRQVAHGVDCRKERSRTPIACRDATCASSRPSLTDLSDKFPPLYRLAFHNRRFMSRLQCTTE